MIASHFSQHRDRLAQMSQRFHARAIFALNFFLDRDATFVAVEERFDLQSVMVRHCSNGVAIA
jgi:hypothetical protein